MDMKRLEQTLKGKARWPRHGWVEVPDESGLACFVMPFLGRATQKHEGLKEKGDPAAETLWGAYDDFRQRLILFIKSLQLFHNSLKPSPPPHDFAEEHVLLDAVLCEFSCAADSLAGLVYALFEEVEPPHGRRYRRRFTTLRNGASTWSISCPRPETRRLVEALKGNTDWYDRAKKLRNDRTHEKSWISGLSDREGGVWVNLNVQAPAGVRKYSINDQLQEAAFGLFGFLEKITPSAPKPDWLDHCVLGSGMGGYPTTFPAGPWLEQLVPRLIP